MTLKPKQMVFPQRQEGQSEERGRQRNFQAGTEDVESILTDAFYSLRNAEVGQGLRQGSRNGGGNFGGGASVSKAIKDVGRREVRKKGACGDRGRPSPE